MTVGTPQHTVPIDLPLDGARSLFLVVDGGLKDAKAGDGDGEAKAASAGSKSVPKAAAKATGTK